VMGLVRWVMGLVRWLVGLTGGGADEV
jgi:hypothetical protein